jgi:hypothetical protein
MSVQSFRSVLLLAALFIGAAAVPSSLSAQRGGTADRGTRAVEVSAIPTSVAADTILRPTAAGPRVAPAGFARVAASSVPGPARPIGDSRTGDNRNVALMGVGAAAVGLGLIIGGDGGTVIAVTGGVIGLVALYRYLR